MAEYVRKEEIPVTKQDKTVLVEGLKKLSADVADLAARLEGSEAPAEKSRAGFRAEVKALLAEFGVSQLSDVKDPGKLAEIVKKAEGIGNA